MGSDVIIVIAILGFSRILCVSARDERMTYEGAVYEANSFQSILVIVIIIAVIRVIVIRVLMSIIQCICGDDQDEMVFIPNPDDIIPSESVSVQVYDNLDEGYLEMDSYEVIENPESLHNISPEDPLK